MLTQFLNLVSEYQEWCANLELRDRPSFTSFVLCKRAIQKNLRIGCMDIYITV